jgi:hypothetical protein
MFPVVGVDAVSCQDYGPISLVGVDNGCADAGMGIDSGHDDRIGFETGECLVQSGPVKRAVALLDDDNIGRSYGQLRKNLTPAFLGW